MLLQTVTDTFAFDFNLWSHENARFFKMYASSPRNNFVEYDDAQLAVGL